MGRLLLLLVLLAACEEHGSPGRCGGDAGAMIGDQFPKGDGCNVCTCTEQGVVCTEISCFDGSFADGPTSCAPSGPCSSGPFCGGVCCAEGELCIGSLCMCGGQKACSNGDTCQAGASGPPGGGLCGTLCCGGVSPCPVAVY